MTDQASKLLNLVFRYFLENAHWPPSRWVEVEFAETGDLEAVAEELGPTFIRYGEPAIESSTCTLTLRGVAHCPGSEQDLANFVRIIPLFAEAYKNSGRVKRIDVVHDFSLGELEGRRLFELVHTDGTLTHGGLGSDNGWDEFGGSREAFKLRKVSSIEEYLERKALLYPPQKFEWYGLPRVPESPTEIDLPVPDTASTAAGDLNPLEVDTSLIADPELRAIVDSDLSELRICYQNGAWKSVGLLAGSCCEAMLIDLLARNPSAIPTKHAAQWKSKLGLREFARIATDAGLISPEGHELIHTVKRWRDLVHPWRATSSRQPSRAIARTMLAFLELLTHDLEVHRPAD